MLPRHSRSGDIKYDVNAESQIVPGGHASWVINIVPVILDKNYYKHDILENCIKFEDIEDLRDMDPWRYVPIYINDINSDEKIPGIIIYQDYSIISIVHHYNGDITRGSVVYKKEDNSILAMMADKYTAVSLYWQIVKS